jgi:hypothetical protein
MEAAQSSKMSVNIYQTTQHHIPEGSNLPGRQLPVFWSNLLPPTSRQVITFPEYCSLNFHLCKNLRSHVNKLDIFVQNTGHVQWNICSGDLKVFTHALKQLSVCYAAATKL